MPSLPDKPIIAQPAPRLNGYVVLVLRECGQCHQRKPLEHFLLHAGRGISRDVKVCAACRGSRKTGSPRYRGRYLDLPLDDWAELTA